MVKRNRLVAFAVSLFFCSFLWWNIQKKNINKFGGFALRVETICGR